MNYILVVATALSLAVHIHSTYCKYEYYYMQETKGNKEFKKELLEEIGVHIISFLLTEWIVVQLNISF